MDQLKKIEFRKELYYKNVASCRKKYSSLIYMVSFPDLLAL